MFNLGFGELLVIGIILIIVIGPDRLPEMMRTMGQALRGFQKANRDLQQSMGLDQLRRELLYPPIDPEALRKKQALIESAAAGRPAETQTAAAGSAEPAAPVDKDAGREGGGEHKRDGG